ncbi:hypothetical protein V8B55DRAFT_1532171 [Mucor lusitanicus]|uniref:Uncharacterized protein n=1 Tax=Mucor lusitanicus CBS 277.49 TaxID=747725 RepID=A0A168IL69_MUCCL|nr:hypothetical protein MUCCIDRAFT_165892 [Mucor lusitanicus CBS 277.49]
MFSHIQHAQDAHNSQPFLHPHDPNVEKEYETLIQAWKNQLIDKTPASPSYEYIRFAWMRLMDHYLDQQWLDSKQMLQCAQAWSARDSISITEAVHTMNILSLKSMQRSLDARQELLQALGDPDFMVGFGVSAIDTSVNPLAGTEVQDEDDDEEDRQVHAPLLVKHNNTPVEESFNILREEEDEAIMTTDSKPEQTESEEDLIELDHQVFKQQSFRLTSSSSTPNISLRSSQDDFSFNKSGFNRKYESYYQQLNQASCWKEMEMKQDEVSITSDDQSIYSDHSDINEQHVQGGGIQWKSWFVDEQPDHQQQQQQPLLAPEEPIIFEQEFADEKVETDACLAELYNPQPKKNQPFLMVRSESSISAFRPISNNLAPRCQQLNPLPLMKRSSSSISIEKAESHHQPLQLPAAATITKSRSFPTKASLSASFKTAPSSSSASSPPPMPTHSTSVKERNFMIRSIVGKKVSLSKLFGSRKSSSSSSSSSHH